MKHLAFLLLSAALTSSCMMVLDGNVRVSGTCSETGIDYSEERALSAFDEVRFSGPFNVYYVQAPEFKAVVEGKREFVGKLKAKVSDGCLSLKLEDGKYHNLVLRVTVFSPDVECIASSGSGDIILSTDVVTEDDLDLRTAGSGDIISDYRITAEEVAISTSGSGDVSLASIVCEDFSYKSSGSGDLFIQNAAIEEDLQIKTSGSGDAFVNGYCRNLSIKTSGSGDVSGNLKYKSIQTSVSGSGEISFR